MNIDIGQFEYVIDITTRWLQGLIKVTFYLIIF